MAKVSERAPVLVVPGNMADHPQPHRPETADLASRVTPFQFPHIPDRSEFEPHLLQPIQWAALAIKCPGLMRDFMSFPHEASVLREMTTASRHVASDIATSTSAAPSIDDLASWQEITAANADALLATLYPMGRPHRTRMRVLFNPETGFYKVEFGRPPIPQPGAARLELGAWILSSLGTTGDEMQHTVFEDPTIDAVLAGSRMLYVQDTSLLTHPQLLSVRTEEVDGARVKSFWTPRPGQFAPKGSSLALRVTNDIHERLNVDDLLETLSRQALEVRARGLTPAVAVDLDGTMMNARAFTVMIFKEWLAQYTGQDREEIRTLVKLKNLKQGWNTASILKDLGITREETLKDALEYFNRNFYSATRRLEVPAVQGTVEVLRQLQQMGIKAVFTTLRTTTEDALPPYDELPEQTRKHLSRELYDRMEGSSSRIRLFQLGIYDAQSEITLHRGAKIDWSEAAFRKSGGKNEPDKWEMVDAYQAKHPDICFIGTFDNAPNHTNGYRERYGNTIVNIHVEGDLPPGSPRVEDGIFSVKPAQLADDFALWHYEMTEYGRETAEGFVETVASISSAIASTTYRHDTNRFADALQQGTRQIAEHLTPIVNLHAAHPTKKAFLGALNKAFSHPDLSLEILEDVLDEVNRMNPNYGFVVIRDQGHITDIISHRHPAALSMIPEPTPVSVVDDSIDIMTAPSFDRIVKGLQTTEAGPDLLRLSQQQQATALAFAEYPRLNRALATMLRTLTEQNDLPPQELVTREYNPRRAIGGLIALARMGVNVLWSDSSEAGQLQTMRELNRLPRGLQDRMIFVTPEDKIDTHLALWNMPQEDFTISEMSRHVVTGGFVAVQSQHMPPHFQAPGAELVHHVKLNAGDYVLPSAYLHVGTPIMPLTFQIWQVKV